MYGSMCKKVNTILLKKLLFSPESRRYINTPVLSLPRTL